MTNSRSFKTTLRIQPQLNSTQTTELGTTQLKLVFVYFDNLFDVKDVNYRYLHEKYKIQIKIRQDKKPAVIVQLLPYQSLFEQ